MNTRANFTYPHAFYLLLLETILLVTIIVLGINITHQQNKQQEPFAPPEREEGYLKQEEVYTILNGDPILDPDDPLIVDYVRRILVGPSERPLKLNEPNITDASQANQSTFIDELLGRKNKGFYLECGAGDGEHLSNSLFFERQRQWGGLLIEADPHNFESILYRQRRAFAINACLSPDNRTRALQFFRARERGSLENITERLTVADRQHVTIQKIQCFPLYSILLALDIRHIDYFSLDVEGQELPVLATVPFGKVTIDTFTVEIRILNRTGVDWDASKQRLKDVQDFFSGTGIYDFVGMLPPSEYRSRDFIQLDAVFRRKGMNTAI